MGEGVSSMLLVNVLSGTEYSVKVIASYSTGPSEPLSGRAKTRKSQFYLQTRLICPCPHKRSTDAGRSEGLFFSPSSVSGGEQPDAVPGEDDQPVRPVAASASRQHLQDADRVPVK